MITANLAGTQSHLRPDRGARDSTSHSRLNLNLECDPEAGDKYKNGETKDTDSENAGRLQNLDHRYRFKKCIGDYKTWGYLACVALVIAATIILIILAAGGFLNTDGSKR